jgi:hypothetical protein
MLYRSTNVKRYLAMELCSAQVAEREDTHQQTQPEFRTPGAILCANQKLDNIHRSGHGIDIQKRKACRKQQ